MALEIKGPCRQPQVPDVDSNVCWKIQFEQRPDVVGSIGSITYGKVAEGYYQKYPESGQAPPIIEGERYFIWVDTKNASGFRAIFTIKDGKVDLYKF